MAQLRSFRSDKRIPAEIRAELRAFSTELGGEIVTLAKRLGLKVFEDDLPFCEAGYLEYAPSAESQSGYRIVVNKNHRPEKQRFTVAHEIAHFVLHRNEPSEEVLFERLHRLGSRSLYLLDAEEDMEQEADAFAVHLLMPAGLVRNESRKPGMSCRELARSFQVSNRAMEIRLEELRIDFRSSSNLHEMQRLRVDLGV